VSHAGLNVACKINKSAVCAPPSNSIKNQFGTGAHNTRVAKQNANEREVKIEALHLCFAASQRDRNNEFGWGMGVKSAPMMMNSIH
jgi:hypothetical protein